MKIGLSEKIQSRGYWRINFRPSSYDIEQTRLADCFEVVKKNHVRVRGWDYPHVPRKNDELEGEQPRGNFWEAWVDWQHHKEFWRMYRSRQFIHFLGLREDWYEESDFTGRLAEQIRPGTVLGITGSTVYQASEIIEFLSRLARDGFYKDQVICTLSLQNMEGRELWIEDPLRGDFVVPRKTGAQSIRVKRRLDIDELIGEPREIALSIAIEIFDNFGWSRPPLETFRADQEKLFSGKT